MTVKPTHACDLAIVGANYAGLTMALAARHALPTSTRIAIIDQAPVPEAGGITIESDPRATAITAASRNMLIRLGVWKHLENRAQPMTDIDLTDSPLNDVVRPVLLHYENRTDDDEPASWMVENHHLKAALLQEIAKRSDIKIVAPAKVLALGSGEGTTRRLEMGAEYLAAGLIVAADGRRSFIRRKAGIKTVSWSYPQIGIVTTVTHPRPHDGKATQHFLPGGPFAILPLKGHRSSLVWTEDKEEATRIMALDDDGFLTELIKRFGHKLGDLALGGPRASWPLDMTIARDMISNRLALIGDAAHGVHPIAGQGLNIAFADIASLVECVSESASLGLPIGDAQALKDFQRTRRFSATRDAFTMDAINRLFSNDNGALRAVRDIGFGLVDRIPGLKRRIVDNAAGLAGNPPPLCAPLE